MPSMEVSAPCPACGVERGVELNTVTHEMAYFGDVVESVLRCRECGYRTASTLIPDQSEAARHRLDVEGDAGLEVRVVRSTSCTVRVPELGVKVEPAGASEAYITNVEGILQRVRRVLVQVLHGGDEEQRERAEELLDRLDAMTRGDEGFTLILDDPMGNSAIADDDVETRELTKEEVEELPTGMRVYEVE